MVKSTPPPLPGPAVSTAAAATAFDVLLIDDDESVLSVMGEVLRRNGYSFASAGDGRSALALLAQHSFRLVVTDIYMPDMDGLELIMKYTASNPQALILAISGGSRGNFADSRSSLRPAQLLGSRRTLAKPFGLTEFLGAVEEMLAGQTA